MYPDLKFWSRVFAIPCNVVDRRSFSFTNQVEVNKLSEDFSVDDELDDGSEVPWIHFEQDVVNLHSHGGTGCGDKAHVTRSSCSSKPSITPLNMAAKAGHTEIVTFFFVLV